MTTLLSNFASIRMPENVCAYVRALPDVGERKYAQNQRLHMRLSFVHHVVRRAISRNAYAHTKIHKTPENMIITLAHLPLS